jgi:hypothetical protein
MLLVVCHNPTCRDSLEQKPTDPRPMVRTGETFSAWTFKCETCGALRAVTKDQIGGTWGQGKTDEQRGKGLKRYTPGRTF